MATIRSGGVDDAASIAHVHVQSWRTTYAGLIPEEYLAALNEAERVPLWQDWLARDLVFFVAEWEGEVVGFAAGGAIREPVGDYDAELYTLYLLERAQRRGLGTALLQRVVKALIARGHQGMMVWVLAQNPATGFYEKAGGRQVASKEIEIGGVCLLELALGWTDLPAGLVKELGTGRS